MSKLGDALKEFDIHNTYGLLLKFGIRGKDVAVIYHPYEPRGFSAESVVESPTFKTDPKSHWSNHGRKAFVGNKKESFPKAVKWAEETYEIEGWKPCPLIRGTWVPAYVVEAAKAFLKENAS